jgi:hypothetical protein
VLGAGVAGVGVAGLGVAGAGVAGLGVDGAGVAGVGVDGAGAAEADGAGAALPPSNEAGRPEPCPGASPLKHGSSTQVCSLRVLKNLHLPSDPVAVGFEKSPPSKKAGCFDETDDPPTIS